MIEPPLDQVAALIDDLLQPVYPGSRRGPFIAADLDTAGCLIGAPPSRTDPAEVARNTLASRMSLTEASRVTEALAKAGLLRDPNSRASAIIVLRPDGSREQTVYPDAVTVELGLRVVAIPAGQVRIVGPIPDDIEPRLATSDPKES